MSALLDLVFSSAGAWIAGAVAFLVALWRAYSFGRRVEQGRADREVIDLVEQRKKIHEDNARLDSRALRQRLLRWARRD